MTDDTETVTVTYILDDRNPEVRILAKRLVERQDEVKALKAENERLRAALGRCAEGYEILIECKYDSRRYLAGSKILLKEARAALEGDG